MNIIKNEIDIFMISETKIENSFPISQFTITVYSISFRLDWASRRQVKYFCLSRKTFLVKQLKLTAMLIFRGYLWRQIKERKNSYLAVRTIHIKLISQTV